MKKIIRMLFLWVFSEEIHRLGKTIECADRQRERFENLLNVIDVNVDAHTEHRGRFYSPSWAIISIQGEKQDFIKFIDLGKRDIRDIAHFLRFYETLSVEKLMLLRERRKC